MGRACRLCGHEAQALAVQRRLEKEEEAKGMECQPVEAVREAPQPVGAVREALQPV